MAPTDSVKNFMTPDDDGELEEGALDDDELTAISDQIFQMFDREAEQEEQYDSEKPPSIGLSDK